MFRHHIGSLAFLLSVAVSLSACGSGPPPKLYLLESPVLESGPIIAETSEKTLGISKVRLPGYATDERIASLSANGVVSQFNNHRWAEEPEDAITRLLAYRLVHNGAKSVLEEPWPRDYEPDARVEISFSRLLREAHGGSSLSGQIQLLSGDGRALLQLIPFEFVVRGESTGSQEFFRAVAVGIDEIAKISMDALLTMNRDS